MGLPFFDPMFDRHSQLSFWSSQSPAVAGANLDVLLSSPYSPAWDSIAATFQLASADLRAWNEVPAETPLEPGALLFVPRR